MMENNAMKLNKVLHIHLKYPKTKIRCLFLTFIRVINAYIISTISKHKTDDRTCAGGKNKNLRSVNHVFADVCKDAIFPYCHVEDMGSNKNSFHHSFRSFHSENQ